MTNKIIKNPKFHVGQIVRINTNWYKTERKEQQYQRITKVWPWIVDKIKSIKYPWGYSLLNGDKCNERYLEPLSSKESRL